MSSWHALSTNLPAGQVPRGKYFAENEEKRCSLLRVLTVELPTNFVARLSQILAVLTALHGAKRYFREQKNALYTRINITKKQTINDDNNNKRQER